MVSTSPGSTRRSLGGVKAFALTLLVVAAVLAVVALFSRDRIGSFLDQRNTLRMAVLIQGELTQIRMATSYYTSMNGGPGALTPEIFDAEGRGQGQLFDPTFTGLGRPIPPPAALQRAGTPARYELIVDDLLGGRGPDRIVVFRGVSDAVCLAFQKQAANPADPLQPDPENRYPGTKGCTRDTDTDELVIFDVLHTS